MIFYYMLTTKSLFWLIQELYEFMCQLSLGSQKITDLLNNSFHTPEEIQDIFSDLTGKPADKTSSCFRRFIQISAKT